MRTLYPEARRRSDRCEPMKPAPPVINTRFDIAAPDEALLAQRGRKRFVPFVCTLVVPLAHLSYLADSNVLSHPRREYALGGKRRENDVGAALECATTRKWRQVEMRGDRRG